MKAMDVGGELVEIRLTFGGMHGAPLKDTARALMLHLSTLDRVVDPVVSADPDHGEVCVSFDLRGASGDALDDVREALRLVDEAQARHGGTLSRPNRVEYLKAS